MTTTPDPERLLLEVLELRREVRDAMKLLQSKKTEVFPEMLSVQDFAREANLSEGHARHVLRGLLRKGAARKVGGKIRMPRESFEMWKAGKIQ